MGWGGKGGWGGVEVGGESVVMWEFLMGYSLRIAVYTVSSGLVFVAISLK